MTWTRSAFIPTAVLLIALLLTQGAEAVDVTLRNAPAQVHFSSDRGTAQAVVKEIDGAAMEVLVRAHSLADPKIIDALVGAKSRGVSVEVILDKSGKSGRASAALASVKIPVYIGASRANNDIIVIDKTTVISGPLDFGRRSGEGEAGNLLIVKSKELAGPYLDNWLKHRQYCRVYQKKAPPKRRS